jgi:hypothetical protein
LNIRDITFLQEFGKTHPPTGIFLSYVQVEFGLDYLKEQWSAFHDFVTNSGEHYPSLSAMVADFVGALNELTSQVYH